MNHPNSGAYWLFVFALLAYTRLMGQTPIENEIYIWDDVAPGSEILELEESIVNRHPNGSACYLNRVVTQVTAPSIKHFAPEHPNGKAVLICPGGGYAVLAYDKEGYDIAQWYNERDITAFVLKYRLPVDGHSQQSFVPLQDAQRAMRYIRAHADSFQIDPNQIGVMGGSAGGHLAASLSVHHDWKVYEPRDAIDSLSARPDFTVLLYPVISFQDNLTHSGSRTNLLGSSFTQAQKDFFSTEMHVDSTTPPAFLFHSQFDGSVKYQNSEAYASALDAAGITNAVHIYNNGGHGQGICEAGSLDFSRWPNDLEVHLVEQGLTTPCQGNLSITVDRTDTTQLIASAAAHYQWYRNGIPVPNATAQTYTPVIAAEYTVATSGQRDISGSGCTFFAEAVTVDVLVDIENLVATPVHIYPNPASTRIRVEQINYSGKAINYQIFNQQGACVQQRQVSLIAGSLDIPVDSLANGMYYLLLTTDTQLLKGQFVKQK